MWEFLVTYDFSQNISGMSILKMEKTRCKFLVTAITRTNWSPTGATLKLDTVYDSTIPEDQRFAKATPSGHIEISVDNPAAVEFLELGKAFYVDFVPV